MVHDGKPSDFAAIGGLVAAARGATDGVRYVECASSRYGARLRHQQCGGD